MVDKRKKQMEQAKAKQKGSRNTKKLAIIGIVSMFVIILLTGGLIYYSNRSTLIIEIEPIPSDPDADDDPIEDEIDEEFRVMLHQSFENETDVSMSSSDNSLIPKVPVDEQFISSHSEIGLKNIAANDYTIVEDHGLISTSDYLSRPNQPLVASFTVPYSCKISNISVFGNPTSTNPIRFYIYNSSWDSVNSRSKPGGAYNQNFTGYSEQIYSAGDQWVSLNQTGNPNTLLNTAQTMNNTFFIGIDVEIGGLPRFWWAFDESTDQYNYYWDLGDWQVKNVDFTFNITFAPITDEIIEDHGLTTSLDIYASLNSPIATSFHLESSSFINKIQVYGTTPATNDIRFYIYNSTSENKPYGNYNSNLTGGIVSISASGEQWIEFDTNILLNVDETYNNTFFLGIDTTPYFAWAYSTNGDSQHSYLWDANWGSALSADFTFNITYIPLDSLGLAINEEEVDRLVWSSENAHPSFEFTSNWSNLSWDVDYVHQNFTKTYEPTLVIDESINTQYYQIHIDLTQFDVEFSNHYIRVRIPLSYNITYIYYNPTMGGDSQLDYNRSGVDVFISGFDVSRPAFIIYMPLRDQDRPEEE